MYNNFVVDGEPYCCRCPCHKDDFRGFADCFGICCSLVDEKFIDTDGSLDVVRWEAACIRKLGSVPQTKPEPLHIPEFKEFEMPIIKNKLPDTKLGDQHVNS